MDDAILNEFQSIRFVLVLLLAAVTILMIFVASWVTRAMKMVETQEGMDRRTQFIVAAKDLEDKGHYEELADFCASHLMEFPKDARATYYRGLAQLQLGQLDKALDSMSRYRKLDPINGPDTADDYIEAIRSQMKGPTRHDT